MCLTFFLHRPETNHTKTYPRRFTSDPGHPEPDRVTPEPTAALLPIRKVQTPLHTVRVFYPRTCAYLSHGRRPGRGRISCDPETKEAVQTRGRLQQDGEEVQGRKTLIFWSF